MTTPLRNPSLAPVYAAVIAFAVVLSLGPVFPIPAKSGGGQGQSKDEPIQPRVRIAVGADQGVPTNLTMLPVGIRVDDDEWERVTLDPDGNLMVAGGKPVLDRYVCISLPPGWTVHDNTRQLGDGQEIAADGRPTPSTCTDKTIESKDDQQAVLTLVRPVVRVESDGGQPLGQFKDAPVLVGGTLDGSLNDQGRHVRIDAVGGKKVCVTPPPGWNVVGVRLDKQTAQPTGPCVIDLKGPVSSPDIVFTLEKGQ